MGSVKSYFAERLRFYTLKHKLNESVAEWEAIVKRAASNCKFGKKLDTIMKDIFVIALNNDKTIDYLFEENATSKTFKEIVKIALAKESALREHIERENLRVVTRRVEPVNYNQQHKYGAS